MARSGNRWSNINGKSNPRDKIVGFASTAVSVRRNVVLCVECIRIACIPAHTKHSKRTKQFPAPAVYVQTERCRFFHARTENKARLSGILTYYSSFGIALTTASKLKKCWSKSVERSKKHLRINCYIIFGSRTVSAQLQRSPLSQSHSSESSTVPSATRRQHITQSPRQFLLTLQGAARTVDFFRIFEQFPSQFQRPLLSTVVRPRKVCHFPIKKFEVRLNDTIRKREIG